MTDTYLKQILYFLLILTVISGIFLRIYKITRLEPYIDEASIGYNAYLLSHYHLDEWGSRWPLHFQAFGEWKLPLYIYSVTVTGQIVGFNNWAIRLPSLLAGLVIALLIFLLLRKISHSTLFSLLAVNFYLFNFWSFMLSRTGFEANLALFFIVSAIFIFLYFPNNQLSLIVSSFFLTLAFFTYNGAQIVAPFIFLILVGYYLKKLFSQKQLSIKIVAILVASSLWLPVLFLSWRFSHNPTALMRLKQVGQWPSLSRIIKTYFKSFSYTFWLGQGDKIVRHTQPGFGNSDLVSYFLFLFGLILLFVQKKLNYLFSFLALWIIALIPGLITKHPLHNLRDVFLLALFLSCLFYGLYNLFSYLQNKKSFYSYLLISWFIFILAILPFYYSYFHNYLKDPFLQWGSGYQHLVNKLSKQCHHCSVYIDTQRVQPYIYWAWYLKIPPQNLVHNTPDKWFLSSVAQINNFFFQPLSKPQKCYKDICYTIINQ